MDLNIDGWLNLAIRWAHVIAGIAWIGSSFYFNWLDSRLKSPVPPREGIEGELWLVHSGGFYRVEKIDVAPEFIPKELHWFKWEAGFTGITGLLLLGLVYYFGANLFLIDPNVADIGPALAIGIGVVALVASWLIYDKLWQSPLAKKSAPAVITICIGLLVLLSIGLTQVFSGRGAFIHIGAVLGTIMVANVFERIIPAQNKLVAARRAGTKPDPGPALSAKQRSVHNNYMTLPVVFIMLSGHYPFIFGHAWSWALMLVIFAAGVAVRHFFNLRNKGRTNYWLVPAAVAAVVLLMFAVAPRTDTGDQAEIAFVDVQAVIAQRCSACHAANPTDESFAEPPAGVMFDTAELIRRNAQRINAQAVLTQAMPLGNITEMTEDERYLLGRWIRAGAPIE